MTTPTYTHTTPQDTAGMVKVSDGYYNTQQNAGFQGVNYAVDMATQMQLDYSTQPAQAAVQMFHQDLLTPFMPPIYPRVPNGPYELWSEDQSRRLIFDLRALFDRDSTACKTFVSLHPIIVNFLFAGVQAKIMPPQQGQTRTTMLQMPAVAEPHIQVHPQVQFSVQGLRWNAPPPYATTSGPQAVAMPGSRRYHPYTSRTSDQRGQNGSNTELDRSCRGVSHPQSEKARTRRPRQLLQEQGQPQFSIKNNSWYSYNTAVAMSSSTKHVSPAQIPVNYSLPTASTSAQQPVIGHVMVSKEKGKAKELVECIDLTGDDADPIPTANKQQPLAVGFMSKTEPGRPSHVPSKPQRQAKKSMTTFSVPGPIIAATGPSLDNIQGGESVLNPPVPGPIIASTGLSITPEEKKLPSLPPPPIIACEGPSLGFVSQGPSKAPAPAPIQPQSPEVDPISVALSWNKIELTTPEDIKDAELQALFDGFDNSAVSTGKSEDVEASVPATTSSSGKDGDFDYLFDEEA